MTRIKRKSFIIKYFARIAERTDLQKKTKNSNASVIRLLAVYFGNNGGIFINHTHQFNSIKFGTLKIVKKQY